MPKSRAYGGLDAFRILAALLVVAIHISPLTTYSAAGDFFLTRCLARVAVPFFFMVTGHFVLGQVLEGKGSFAPLGRQVRKILLLYLVAVVLYLPIGWYAGHYQDLSLLDGVRLLVFDGTFYHLWYFPACAMGLLVVYGLSRVFRGRGLWVAVGVLYAIALLGDSYYGLTAQIAPLASLYEAGFHLFSYTRNGLFMAPLFLLLGAQMGKRGPAPLPWAAGLGLALSLALMTGEGFLLRHLGLQRHDSMYLLLPLVMCFLYRLLLAWPAKAPAACRTLSTWVYILHPAMLVVLRGGAKVVGLTEILVGNSLVQYLMVCLLSFLAAGVVTWVLGRLRPQVPQLGRAWVQLDRAALVHNVAALRALLPPGCQLMPAVKADAYGHGALPVARILQGEGVSAFCVACLSEGIQLRKGGIRGEILILGYTHPDQFPLLRRYRLSQTVVDAAYARQLAAYGRPLSVHLAVDTGMHRLGEASGHLEEIRQIFALPSLRIQGIYTHLCTADGTTSRDQAYVHRQAQAFRELLERLQNQGIALPKVHLLASHGLLNYPDLGGDYARVGIALYGLLSAREDRNLAAPDLRPVLSLRARVASVKTLSPGCAAGYGLRGPAAHQGGGAGHRLRRRAAPDPDRGAGPPPRVPGPHCGADLHGPDPGGRDGNPRRGPGGRSRAPGHQRPGDHHRLRPGPAGRDHHQRDPQPPGPPAGADRPITQKPLLPAGGGTSCQRAFFLPSTQNPPLTRKWFRIRGGFVVTGPGRGRCPLPGSSTGSGCPGWSCSCGGCPPWGWPGSPG